MRIIAGKARGRPLLGPKSPKIRPTADRVRESIFNLLGQWMDGWAVLDLFSGTGALALEAISRGAARAVLVDMDREAIRLCRGNASALGFDDQVEVLAMPVLRALAHLQESGARFDLVFADPPYALRAVQDIVRAVTSARLLNVGGILCIEHDKREEVPDAWDAMARTDQRRFGDTRVSIYRLP